MATNEKPESNEITEAVVTASLIGLFKALRKAFTTPDADGAVRAFELIQTLRDIAESDPDVFRTVLTEQNIASFTGLQKKAASGKKVGMMDFLAAFPDVGKAMGKGGLMGMLGGK